MGNDRIRQLYEAILALKSGKISAMPPLSGGDEVALLGSALNEVLDSSARALDTLRDEQSKFISTAAHDLRNPVSALKGFIGVLLESHSAQSPEERQLLIQTEHAADALVALLHDMEDISALNHSKFSLSPYPTPVSAFVY
ncbi:MAG: HAMP domain-containing protein, partial [Ignavibacteriales bacterium]|nr:HAMP domain-containing protein [Ignavibacteriales bacterium]